MSTDKQKKPFWETGFGKFLNSAKDVAPSVLNVATQVIKGSTPLGAAIDIVHGILSEKSANNEKAAQLLGQLENERQQWELEMAKVDASDRDSARRRQVDMVKSGAKDWLMSACGVMALCAFAFLLYAAVYVSFENDALVHELIGMTSTLVIGMFSFYFGSSRGSERKTELIAQK